MNPLKFIPVVIAIADMSLDPSTKVGCLVFDDDSNILVTGFNGLPRMIADTDRRLNERKMKYKFICHAEANAVSQAARVGARLLNANAMVTLFPCSNCAKLLIQAGIKTIYVPKFSGNDAEVRWEEDFEISKIMFKEANIKIIEY